MANLKLRSCAFLNLRETAATAESCMPTGRNIEKLARLGQVCDILPEGSPRIKKRTPCANPRRSRRCAWRITFTGVPGDSKACTAAWVSPPSASRRALAAGPAWSKEGWAPSHSRARLWERINQVFPMVGDRTDCASRWASVSSGRVRGARCEDPWEIHVARQRRIAELGRVRRWLKPEISLS